MTDPLSPRESARLLAWTVNDLAKVLEQVDPETVPAEVCAALAPAWATIAARMRALVTVPPTVLSNGRSA